jgi:long-subunit acyl-CoA synthetase (AMP-forming)
VIVIDSGYFGNPKATKETFSSDGWFMTGDIGRVDDEGFVYVVDRKKELIKYNAVQGMT